MRGLLLLPGVLIIGCAAAEDIDVDVIAEEFEEKVTADMPPYVVVQPDDRRGL